MSTSITSPRRLRDARGETCDRCPFFAPLLEPGHKPADYGWCMRDGEGVRADNPMCSGAPSGRAGISAEADGCDES